MRKRFRLFRLQAPTLHDIALRCLTLAGAGALSLLLLFGAPEIHAASPTVAYAANNSSNSVSVIDVNTSSVIGTIPVGSVPTELAITLNHKYVLVTNQFGGTVSVISTATNTVAATIPVGEYPVGVATSPNGKLGYVTLAGQNELAVIDLASFTVSGTVGVGPAPTRVSITPDGNFAYVSNQNSNYISVVNTSTLTVAGTRAFALRPRFYAGRKPRLRGGGRSQ